MNRVLSRNPKKTRQVLLRLSENDDDDLRALAGGLGLPVSTLAGMAVKALINYARSQGGKVTLPLDFSKSYEETSDLAEKIARAIAAGKGDKGRGDTLQDG